MNIFWLQLPIDVWSCLGIGVFLFPDSTALWFLPAQGILVKSKRDLLDEGNIQQCAEFRAVAYSKGNEKLGLFWGLLQQKFLISTSLSICIRLKLKGLLTKTYIC